MWSETKDVGFAALPSISIALNFVNTHFSPVFILVIMPKARGRGRPSTVVSSRSKSVSAASENSDLADMEVNQSGSDTTLLIYGAGQFGNAIREVRPLYTGWVVEHLITSGPEHFIRAVLSRPNLKILVADLYTDWCTKNPNLTDWRGASENYQAALVQALLEIVTENRELQVCFVFVNVNAIYVNLLPHAFSIL